MPWGEPALGAAFGVVSPRSTQHRAKAEPSKPQAARAITACIDRASASQQPAGDPPGRRAHGAVGQGVRLSGDAHPEPDTASAKRHHRGRTTKNHADLQADFTTSAMGKPKKKRAKDAS
jgi:hypothetical protein